MNNEFDIKLRRLQELMHRKELDAIYIKRQDNFSWLTCGGRSHVGQGDMGNCGLLVKRDGDRFAITNVSEAARLKEEEKLEDLGFEFRVGGWDDAGFDDKSINNILGNNAIVGCDFSNEASAIKELRYALTNQEIDRYKIIGKEATRVLETVCSSIKSGMTEIEIAAEIIMAMKKEGFESLVCLVASDERIKKYRHPIPTEKRVERLVQAGGNFRKKGLIVSITRFVSFKPLEEAFVIQFNDNQLIDCTFATNTVPGKTYKDVFASGVEAYNKLGYKDEVFKHHQGGATGYSSRDVKVTFSTNGIVLNNQAFAWNPTIAGTKSEETIITTENGILTLTEPCLFPSKELKVGSNAFIRAGVLVSTR